MSTNDNLIKMANQIGTFFETMPERPEAMLGTVTHIKQFWTPSMRRAFLVHVDGGESAEISEFVLSAVRAHRSLID